MPETPSSDVSAATTFCPFKAPSRLAVPLASGELSLRRFEQRPGITLVHANVPSIDPQKSERWLGKSHLQIAFISEGQLTLSPENGKPLLCQAGDWFLAKPIDQACYLSSDSSCNLHWLEFDLQATESLTGFANTVAPQLLDAAASFFSSGKTSGRLLALGTELAILEGNDTRERLLIEAKTLEWLALLLDLPAFSPCRAIVPARLSRDDIALNAAAKFLEDRLGEDHSIARLSRAVHLNEFKLKRGFKEKFGTTVFGFLRQKRMERARDLLQVSERSVIETANLVGYSNPSHFARAFKEAFGANPSEFVARR